MLSLCACLWGGMFNPLIPVCRTLPKAWKKKPSENCKGMALTRGYIRFFEPDVYVEAQPGLAKECGIDRDSDSHFFKNVVALDDFVTFGDGCFPKFAFGLNIIEAYRELHSRQYAFEPRPKKKALLFEGRDASATFSAAVSGAFPDSDELQFFRANFLRAFDARIRVPSAKCWVRYLASSANDPLRTTCHGLIRHPDRSWHPRVFFADPGSSHDLIDLWNLRQFHSNVLPFNVRWITDGRTYLRDYVRRSYRPPPGSSHGFGIPVTIEFGRSFAPARAMEISRRIFHDLPEKSWALKMHYDAIWDSRSADGISRPDRATVEADSRMLDFDIAAETAPTLTFRSLSPSFAEEFGSRDAGWVNTLSLADFGGESGLAITMPSTTLKLKSPGLSRSSSLITSREGFVFPQTRKDYSVRLALPTGQQVIKEWLRDRGIEAATSDPGRIVDQISFSPP